MAETTELVKSDNFFEGAEKLLELWFIPSDNGGSLRKIPTEELIGMLDLACCHILHFKGSKKIDSYILSESSMFISDNRIIIKTCGATRLLDTVNRILDLAKQYASMTLISNVYYSRKNFLRPDLQPTMYKSFDGETDELSKYFDEGVSFCLGSLRNDRWYLYTNEPCNPPTLPDHTLEIQMTELPDDVLSIFSKSVCRDGKECTRKAKIDTLTPAGTLIHEVLFDPVGYSMNGIVSGSDEYVTIHITPEPEFCYISYETNHSVSCLYEQSLDVLNCFKPNKFILTLFANELSDKGKNAQLKLWKKEFPGYRCVNIQCLRLEFETLLFGSFVKETSGSEYKSGVKYKSRKIFGFDLANTFPEP